LGRNSSQNGEIWGSGGQKCRNGGTAFGACLQMAVKKNLSCFGTNKKISICKSADKKHWAWQICSGAKNGRGFYRDSVGTRVPKTYPKSTQNGPKTYPRDITVTPKNIFEIKNQNIYFF
jgi:hypothetical protein